MSWSRHEGVVGASELEPERLGLEDEYCHRPEESGSLSDDSEDDQCSNASLEPCCSTKSELTTISTWKRDLIEASFQYNNLSSSDSLEGSQFDQEHSQDCCTICRGGFSEVLPCTLATCCGRYVHELCYDEDMDDLGECRGCHQVQHPSTPSDVVLGSEDGPYIFHFTTKPKQAFDSYSTTHEKAKCAESETLEHRPSHLLRSMSAPSVAESRSPSLTGNPLEVCEPTEAIHHLKSAIEHLVHLWEDHASKVSEGDKARIVKEILASVEGLTTTEPGPANAASHRCSDSTIESRFPVELEANFDSVDPLSAQRKSDSSAS